jgi:hypothetical protein
LILKRATRSEELIWRLGLLKSIANRTKVRPEPLDSPLIPSGRTIGVSGGVGAVGSVIGGGELVVNYDSGQVSAFVFGGAQVGWNGGLSGSLYSAYIYGLDRSNSNYSAAFTGVNAGAGIGSVFVASSSGKLTGGARGLLPNGRPTVVGGGVGASLVGDFSFGASSTHYTKPLQLGKFWPLASSPTDALLFTARQLCK